MTCSNAWWYFLKSSNLLTQATIQTSWAIISYSINIIEWAEIIKNKPKNRLEIYLTYKKKKDLRDIEFKGFGKWKEFNAN